MNYINDSQQMAESIYRGKSRKDELFNIVDTISDEELMDLMDELNNGQTRDNKD